MKHFSYHLSAGINNAARSMLIGTLGVDRVSTRDPYSSGQQVWSMFLGVCIHCSRCALPSVYLSNVHKSSIFIESWCYSLFSHHTAPGEKQQAGSVPGISDVSSLRAVLKMYFKTKKCPSNWMDFEKCACLCLCLDATMRGEGVPVTKSPLGPPKG